MINETKTFEKFGYNSSDLSSGSSMLVYVVCDKCKSERILSMNNYTRLKESGRCKSCIKKGMKRSESTISKISNASRNRSDETLAKLSKARVGKNMSKETRDKISASNLNPSDETRIKMSCAKQNIDRSEWLGFICNTPYCEKFNDACRERIRDKYNRLCFLCGKSEKDNGKRLSVHHVDMNKDQGCNGNMWSLVPLCAHHHASSHNELWTARIKYLLNNVWD